MFEEALAAHRYIGLSYLMSEKLDEARKAFTQVVKSAPENKMNQKLLKLVESVIANKTRCPRSEEEILKLI